MASVKIEKIVESLKSGDFLELERVVLYLMEDYNSYLSEIDSNKRLREQIERNFYIRLNRFLEIGKFDYFKRLLNFSDKLDIFIDINKIPKRFDFISKIHLNGITSGQIGEIFTVIRFFNDTGLLEREFSKEEVKYIEKIKRDKLIIANLQDLFKRVTNSLIYYTYRTMLENIFQLFLNYFYSSEISGENISFFYSKEHLIRFLDMYAVYGLRVENLGTVEKFIGHIQANKLNSKDKIFDKEPSLTEFNFKNRTHIVSLKNIEKNMDNILRSRDHYKFYNLSMVLLGGLGPQGNGFMYSTPRGEVVEICSDRKETEAIIVKYKEFLKRQFLVKLREEMINLNINTKNIIKIMDFLSEVLNPKEKINYFKKEAIEKQIKRFLNEIQDSPDFQEVELRDLMSKISKAIIIILRPIDMIDQFKCRMDLIEEGKIKSEDIAKLTSLKGKSHYDVLRERFFFQNQIEWFFRFYSDEIFNYRKQREKREKSKG